MNELQAFSEVWRAWMIAASWQVAIFIGLVALLSWALRPFSARLRYALWLLVLVKLLLPPTLSAPWSLGNSAARGMWERANVQWRQRPAENTASARDAFPTPAGSVGSPLANEPPAAERDAARDAWAATPWLLAWAMGAVCFWAFVGWRYRKLARTIANSEPIEEGPLRVDLEKAALTLHVATVPELLLTQLYSSPFLFGVWRPKIVVPQALVQRLGEDELRAVLWHELVHWRRRDTWVGWLQIVVQGLFWFHPLVWWANHQIRHVRESACDETVLQLRQFLPRQYGETLLRVLTAARGRSLVEGSLVGIFERGTRVQSRLEEIMSFEPKKRQFGWVSLAIATSFAALFLPMAGNVAWSAAKQSDGEPNGQEAAPAATPYPQVVSTSPAVGAKDVDPSLDVITITFDRAMRKGMSWTGGPPHLPPLDKNVKAHWKDDRTCVLPVKLEKGKFYRVGVNSQSFQNFRAADGAPAPPGALYFTTQGAAKSLERALAAPTIASIDPKNGAQDVDPATKALKVVFDMPMGKGFSWTGGGADFPTIPAGQQPRWSSDRRSCLLPVKLQPNKAYRLGLNSLSHNNFQSEFGVPLKPVVYEFQTRASE